MSESWVDRILTGQSMEGGGPLTRSLNHTQTSGVIRSDAPHWSIEPYLPLLPGKLIAFLVDRGELDAGQAESFRRLCGELDRSLHRQSASYHTRFAAAYEGVDPDADQRIPLSATTDAGPGPGMSTAEHEKPSHGKPDDGSPGEDRLPAPAMDDADRTSDSTSDSHADCDQQADCQQRAEQVLSVLDEVLTRAGFRLLKMEEITRCVGVVSQFGVPLHVDLEIFQQLVVYARGDVIGKRLRRRLRRLYRPETVEVQVYQRMVLIFQLRDDDPSDEQLPASAVHLRMFKNIPKQDVDTLLPGTRVRISGIDHLKIIVPSLGGFLMSLRRIAQYALLFAVIALHWSAVLVGLLVGYLIKSVFSYFQTKKKYQLNLTRNLYFQKLGANAAVGHHAIQLAHQQAWLEAILALYALLTADQPISHRRLRRRCERLVREAIHVEVDFQIDRALASLIDIGLVEPSGENWRVDPNRCR